MNTRLVSARVWVAIRMLAHVQATVGCWLVAMGDVINRRWLTHHALGDDKCFPFFLSESDIWQ